MSSGEIKIELGTHASDVTMTERDEIKKDNPLQREKQSEIPLEEDPPWLKNLMQEPVKEPKIENGKTPKAKGRKITKVLCRLPDYEECYKPKVVSIGPHRYSDRNGELSNVEKLKAPMAHDFVKACGQNKSKLYAEVKKVEKEARTFYEESIIEGFDGERFMEMMFIDGCFILQFVHCVKSENEKLEMTDEQVGYVKRDLLLLENQLPFPVLVALMQVRYNGGFQGYINIEDVLLDFIGADLDLKVPIAIKARRWLLVHVVYKIKNLSGKISNCCHGLRISRPDSDQPPDQQREGEEEASEEDDQPDANQFSQLWAHLLDILYSILVNDDREGIDPKLIPGKRKRPPHVGSGHYLYYSARNLKRVGIHFQPAWHGDLTDVKFKPSFFYGTLKLPRIVVNESTKSLLLNLVEYEKSTSPDQFWVASYICFMDSLINDAKDVEELRSKGIIFNYLGEDQKVADIFNGVGKHLKPDASTYNDVKRKINKQCENRVSKWVADWREKYFDGPWTLIAVVAAAFGLALTFAQTYYTRYPPCQ